MGFWVGAAFRHLMCFGCLLCFLLVWTGIVVWVFRGDLGGLPQGREVWGCCKQGFGEICWFVCEFLDWLVLGFDVFGYLFLFPV